jgi:hypothetical protein
LARLSKAPRELASLSALHEQSVELILHARRLQQEFTELRETSKLLRLESMQLREEIRSLRLNRFDPSTDYAEEYL